MEDQILDGYVKKMGPELGPLFDAISSELTWLHWRWTQYRQLFGEKPSRIELLNNCAPFFFQVIQNTLFEETLLGISRLIGPVQSVNKPNLSIQRFPLLCNLKIRYEIDQLVGEAKAAGAFAVDWRNRHIAHRDLNLALGRPTKMLEVATREKVETALSSLRNVVNRIEQEYCDATTLYYSPTPWDAESLLYFMREGLLREKEKHERWNRGDFRPDDSGPSEPI